jgi:competence protein ComEA
MLRRLHGAASTARGSTWAPAVLRVLSVGGAMVGLAAIGSNSLPAAYSSPAPSAVNGQVNHGAVLDLPPVLATATAAASAARPAPGTAEAAGSANTPEPEAAPQEDSETKSEPGVTADGKIVLNTANAAQLDRLPGVGPKRAEQIVALRTRLGRFKTLNDLLRIRGIGRRTLQKMLPQLVLDPPPPPKPPDEGAGGSASTPPASATPAAAPPAAAPAAPH